MFTTLVLALAATAANAAPTLVRREVPQEHSHEVLIVATRAVLNKGGNNDPFVRKVDAVFGTLGLAANIKNFEQNADLPADLKDPVCVQQNLADACIDNAKKNGANKNEIATCMQFRVLERNTNGVGLAQDVCKKAPRNAELAGLTQIQDPASDLGKSTNADTQTKLAQNLVKLGFTADQAADLALQTSTFVPGQLGDPTARGNTCDNFPVTADADGDFFGRKVVKGQAIDCITQATLTNGKSKAQPSISKADLLAKLGGGGGAAAGGAAAATGGNNATPTTGQKTSTATKTGADGIVTVTVTVTDFSSCANPGAAAGGLGAANNDKPAAPPVAPPAAAANGNIDFGSCKPPTIRFGLNIDGRKETAFEVVNKDSFSQSSAQNGNIIVRALCDQLRDRCKAPKATQDLCIPAAAAFAAQPDKTGAQADAFNKVFGITTNFKEIQPRDNQGNPIGAPPAQGGNNNGNQQNNNQGGAAAAGNGAGLIAQCKLPSLEFGPGFDGRTENSFRAQGEGGSAQNGAIIIQRICDRAQGECKTLCNKASDAFKALPPKTGAQADAYNEIATGKKTNFAAIA